MKLGTHKLSLAHTVLFSIGIFSLLGQFARFESPVGKINIYELLFIPFIFFTLFTLKKNVFLSRLKLLIHPVSGVCILAIGWSILITLIRIWPGVFSDLSGMAYLGRISLYGLFGAAVFVWVQRHRDHSQFLEKSITVWLIALACLGIGQYLLLPDTRILAELGWDDHLSRAFGTLFDPNFFGLITGMGSLWMFSNGLKSTHRTTKMWWAGGFAITLLATTASFSRGAYGALLVGFLVLAWFLRQRRVLLALPLLVMAILLVPKDGGGAGQNLLRTQSIEQRVDHVQFQTETITLNESIFGRGWSTEEIQKNRQTGLAAQYNLVVTEERLEADHAQFVDSQYIHVWTSSGIVGVFLFLLFCVLWWKEQNALGKAILAAVLVHGIVSPAIFYPWVMLLLVGVSVVSTKKQK